MAKTKTLSIWSTVIQDGETVSAFESLYREFDEAGNKLLEIQRDGEGQDVQREEYSFDSEGRKTREYKHFIADEMEQTHRWEYDEQGRVAKEINEFVGGFQSVKHFSYEAGQNLVKVTDEEGTPEGKEVQTLDGNGRVVEVVEYDEEDTLKAHLTTEYDEAGHVIRKETRSWDDAFEDEWMYEFDEAGRQTVEKQLNQDGYIILRRTNTYDDAGNLVEYIAEDQMRQQKVRRIFEYDEHNQLQAEQAFRNDMPMPDVSVTFAYEGELMVKETVITPVLETQNEYRRTFFTT